MCQAFAGEQAMMIFQEERGRKQGYEAHKAGTAKSDNPELLPWIKKAWDTGWDLADKGLELW